jgi:hypothetical protein
MYMSSYLLHVSSYYYVCPHASTCTSHLNQVLSDRLLGDKNEQLLQQHTCANTTAVTTAWLLACWNDHTRHEPSAFLFQPLLVSLSLSLSLSLRWNDHTRHESSTFLFPPLLVSLSLSLFLYTYFGTITLVKNRLPSYSNRYWSPLSPSLSLTLSLSCWNDRTRHQPSAFPTATGLFLFLSHSLSLSMLERSNSARTVCLSIPSATGFVSSLSVSLSVSLSLCLSLSPPSLPLSLS